MTNTFVKIFYPTLGLTFVLLGLLGVFVPLLPTTPFLLLAGYFFSRSSKKLSIWLENHPILGKYLKDWQATRSIPRKAKILATIMMFSSLLYIIIIGNQTVEINLLNVGASVVVFIGCYYIWFRTKTC